MPKPALVFEGPSRDIFLCVSKAENGGLEFYAQGGTRRGAIVALNLKEVRELAAYLNEHLGNIPEQKIS